MVGPSDPRESLLSVRPPHREPINRYDRRRYPLSRRSLQPVKRLRDNSILERMTRVSFMCSMGKKKEKKKEGRKKVRERREGKKGDKKIKK